MAADGGVPDAPFGVEADAVGDVVAEVGEHPAVGQGAVGGDGEGGEAVGEGLGDHQGTAVGGEDHAVGHQQVGCGHPDGAVGVDQHHHGRSGIVAAVVVEADVADVGPAGRVDQQLVAEPGVERGEVGHQLEATVGAGGQVEGQQAVVVHGHHPQGAVGGPTETSRLGRQRRHLLDGAGAARIRHGHPDDDAGVLVGQPDGTVVPAGALRVAEAVDERFGLQGGSPERANVGPSLRRPTRLSTNQMLA